MKKENNERENTAAALNRLKIFANILTFTIPI